MPTDPEKTIGLTIASHALLMSIMDTLIAKSILTDDEAKGVILSAITAIEDMEGLTNRSAAISILQALLRASDRRTAKPIDGA
jgi:hypothetical protein